MKIKHLILASLALLGGGNFVSAQKDVTSTYITNATLSSLSGWTNSNFNAPVQGANTIGYASECYAGWDVLTTANYSLTQNITLPAGNYRLVNYSFYRSGEAYNTDASTSNCDLVAGSQSVKIKTLGSISGAAGYANSQAEGANCFDSKMYRNVVEFTIAEGGETIEIGLRGTHKQAKDWIIAGMFELFDLDQEPSYEVPTDMTYAITNSGFEYRNATGWTCVDFGTHDKGVNEYSGMTMAEKWQNGTALGSGKSMKQTITSLPNGVYDIKVRAQNIEQYNADAPGTGMYLVAGDKRTEIKGQDEYTVRASTSNGQLTIGIELNNCTGNWVSCDNFKLFYCGIDLEEYKATLTSLRTTAKEILDADKKFNASYKSALQTAYNNTASVTETRQWLEEAMAALQEAVDNANSSIAIYDPITTKYALLDADGKAYFNASTTGAKYLNNTLVNEDITADYIAAVKAQGIGSDMTPLIANPDFEKDTNGWTSTGIGRQTNASFSTTPYAEVWQPSGRKEIHQNITLKEGKYTLTARAKARSVNYAYLYAGNVKTMKIADEENNYSVEFYSDGTTPVTIGAEMYGTGIGGSWFAIDQFRLTYNGNELPEVTALTLPMVATVKSAMEDAVNTYNTTKTAENYAIAVTKIKDAMTSAVLYGDISLVNKKASTLDALGQTAYAPALAKYNNGEFTTLNDANTMFIDAVRAQGVGADMSELIVNANVNQTATTIGWNNPRWNNGQQYTGAPDNYYFDAWSASAAANWNMSQNVKLNAGVYQLKAATRATVDAANVTAGDIYLNRTDKTNYHTDINKNGSTDGELGNGWGWTTVDNIILAEDQTVEIGFYVTVQNGAWAGADDFRLTKTGNVHQFSTTNAWCSLCLDFNAVVPEGAEVYYVSDKDINEETGVGTLTMTQIPVGSVIPANEGIIVNNGTHVFVQSNESPVSISNLLSGTTEETDIEERSVYVLNGSESTEEKVKFSTFTGTSIPAYKAYLPKDIIAGMKSLQFVFEGKEATSTNGATVATQARKNGKYAGSNGIIVVKDGAEFNVNGINK